MTSHALTWLLLATLAQVPAGDELSDEARRALDESEQVQQRQRATALVQEAEQLTRTGQWDLAVQLLSQAARTDPTFARPHMWTGYIEQQRQAAANTLTLRRQHQTAAISAYARALAIAPEDAYSREAISKLFFGDEFPATLDVASLIPAPVQFTVSNCLLTGVGEDGGDVKRGISYTSSVVFAPEDETRTGAEVWPTDPRGLSRYNRVSYGYVADPEGVQLHRRFAIYFPSPALSQPATNHTPLAHRVAASLLRMHCYAEEYLGDAASALEDPLRVWLTDKGDPGGEYMASDILLYDINADREPIEWLREVAHEYGHHVLPHVGHFEHIDEDASGLMGERLFLRWLAEEVLAATGTRWPSAEAQQAFNALWAAPVAMGEFLVSRCDGPINFWLSEGPASEYVGQQTREAAEHFVGFALYIESAHGRPTLAAVLSRLQGRAPSDLVQAYTDTVAALMDRTRLAVDSALFVPSESNINSPSFRTLADTPGALVRPDEHVAYRLYLPAGRWEVRLECDGRQPASFAVALDGKQEQSIVLGEDGSSSAVSFPTGTSGWHLLRIELANADAPVRLLRALVSGRSTAVEPEPKPEPEPAEPNAPALDIPIPDVPVIDSPVESTGAEPTH